MAYPTLANLKTYLAISGATADSELQWALDGAKSTIERMTGRIFVATTGTRYFPVMPPWVGMDKTTLYLHADLAAITSVTNGDGTALSSEYRAIGNNNTAPYWKLVITRTAKLDGTYWQEGADGTEIAIAGDWGYATTCPAAIFDAILRLAAHSYRARSSGQSGQITAVSRRSGLVVGQAEFPKDVLDVIREFKR